MEINLTELAQMVDSVLGPQIGGFVFAALLVLGLLAFLIWACRYIHKRGILALSSFLRGRNFLADWKHQLLVSLFFVILALAAYIFISEIRSRQELQELTEQIGVQEKQLTAQINTQKKEIEVQRKQIEEYQFLLKGTVPGPSPLDDLIERIVEKMKKEPNGQDVTK